MKYIIVGGVAGGASTAARLRRLDEHAEIVMFEKGAYISYANCGLPYYIGDVIKDRDDLFVQTPTSFKKRFNIDVRTQTEVISINPQEKYIRAKDLTNGSIYQESYDKLVLSQGAEPIRPPFPGIDLSGIFTLRNVSDTDRIKEYIQQHQVKRAVVIGAGFVGLEMAENLHHLGIEVSIIEKAPQVLAPVDFPVAAILQQHIRSKAVKLMLNTEVSHFEESDMHLEVHCKSQDILKADMVILSIGVLPDTKIAKEAGIRIGEARGIWVNEYMQTSEPDIYAVGDAIEFIHPITKKSGMTYLAGPANKQGRICAHNLVNGNQEKYAGSIQTAIVKVFDMTVATAGVSSRILSQEGIQHQVSIISSGSHASYYPHARPMTIQIAFQPETGQLLHAQIIGFDGVDKRIDILAQIIQRKGNIAELTEFEHAYAPPFSSAKDPVNMSGFVAENILLKKSFPFQWNELDQIQTGDFFVDVRTAGEYKAGIIGNAINIPLDEIRNRLSEFPKDQRIFIYCLGGLRGYLAQRILLQHGYNQVFNLSGGYQIWETCQKELN